MRRFHQTQDPGRRLAHWGATVGQRSVTMTRGGVPMLILELSDAQVVELVKQLPPERQRAVLLALAAGATQRREERMQYTEAQLRRVSAQCGMDWDTISEGQREVLIDDLLHEDRPCGK